MSEQKLSDDDLIEFMNQGLSQTAIANKKGMNVRTIQRKMASLTRRGISPKHDMTHSVPDGYHVKGTSTLYDADGQLRAQWVKSNMDADVMQKALEAALDGLKDEVPRARPKKANRKNYEDALTAYPIGDPHFGMYAHAPESGDDWDLSIAQDVHTEAMQRLVSEASPTKQAIVVNLGDALHYDGAVPMTARSKNILDSDGRYSKMISVAVATLRRMVDIALTKHEKVHLVNVKGNHDEFSAAWLSELFVALYEKEPRVTVETSPSVHTYYKFGNTLIGMHHGHSTKMEKLPGIMATDRSRDWGDCEYRYWWTGHIHHDSLKEYPGVTVESFGTLAAKDEFAASSGYRSRRSMKRILIDRERGEISRSIVCV